jgi:tetratricopeptide (TPR) repeat protein
LLVNGARVLPMVLVGVAIVGALAYGLHRVVAGNRTRELGLCVATDFGFRAQRPNWEDQFRLWLAETNRVFESAGVIWRIANFGEMTAAAAEGTLDERRTALADLPPCAGDVVLGLSASPDTQSNSSVSPFGHMALASIARSDSDAMAVIVISRTLATLFGVTVGTRTVVQIDNPEAEVLDAGSLDLVRSLRHYDFSKGLSALSPEWESRATDALAKSLGGSLLPAKAAAHRALAVAFADGLRHASAAAHFEEAVRIAPDVASLRVEWAMELQADAHTDEALAQLRKAVQLDPEDARAYALMGAILLNAKRVDEGVRELRTATRLEPRNAAYHAILGRALSSRIGYGVEATAAFEAALRLNPNEPSAETGIRIVKAMRDGARQTLSEYEAEVWKNPASAEAHRRLGSALIAVGDNDAAERSLRHAAQLDLKNGAVRLSLARLYYISRDYTRATEELQAAIQLGSDPGQAFADAIKKQSSEVLEKK